MGPARNTVSPVFSGRGVGDLIISFIDFIRFNYLLPMRSILSAIGPVTHIKG